MRVLNTSIAAMSAPDISLASAQEEKNDASTIGGCSERRTGAGAVRFRCATLLSAHGHASHVSRHKELRLSSRVIETDSTMWVPQSPASLG